MIKLKTGLNIMENQVEQKERENQDSNRFSKSLATNQNEPTTSSEYKDEYQLPNFITKSFVERLSL